MPSGEHDAERAAVVGVGLAPQLPAAASLDVNIGSMWASTRSHTPTSVYSAAQAGRHALTKYLAIEFAPTGIRVNTVALAFVETPAYERFMTREQAQQVLDAVDGFHPLGRRGQPDDVAEAVLFLAGADAAGSPARRCRSTVACSQVAHRRRSRRSQRLSSAAPKVRGAARSSAAWVIRIRRIRRSPETEIRVNVDWPAPIKAKRLGGGHLD